MDVKRENLVVVSARDEVTMGMYVDDLRELVIRPTLLLLDEWSPTAENLLLGTAAQESQLGFRLQHDEGSGLGCYRISARTHIQVWDEYLVTDPELASRLRGLASQQQFLRSPHNELITNLGYATGIAWMVYKRHKLMTHDDASVRDLAEYWLDYYSIRDEQGAQKIHNRKTQLDRFAQNFKKLVLREKKNLAA